LQIARVYACMSIRMCMCAFGAYAVDSRRVCVCVCMRCMYIDLCVCMRCMYMDLCVCMLCMYIDVYVCMRCIYLYQVLSYYDIGQNFVINMFVKVKVLRYYQVLTTILVTTILVITTSVKVKATLLLLYWSKLCWSKNKYFILDLR
jgi:hypothetical protein